MIPVVIHREVDALRTTKSDFTKMVSYVCGKAHTVETCNLLTDWKDADWQMWATAAGNSRSVTLTYHFVLSWPETERPTPEQAIMAAKHAVKALGAENYQFVIGVHTDGTCTHVHIVINRKSLPGNKALSLSNDYLKLEKACREIELQQGWAEDPGRFDVVVEETTDGPVVTLVPKPQSHWDEKQARRERERGAAKSDLHHLRRTGMPPLISSLATAWKQRIRDTIAAATSWPIFHASLNKLGLTYIKRRSGARLKITGSDQFFAPSQLGRRFGFRELVKTFGPWQTAKPAAVSTAAHQAMAFSNKMTCRSSDGEPRLPQGSPRTFLARTYVAITGVEKAATRVDDLVLTAARQRIVFRDGSIVECDRDTIRTTPSEDYFLQARLVIALAKIRGWVEWDVEGDAHFKRAVKVTAAEKELVLDRNDTLGSFDLTLSTAPVPEPDTDRNAETVAISTGPKLMTRSEWRADNGVERIALKAEQRAEREWLLSKIGPKRGVIEQAFRAGLKLFHGDQLKELTKRQKQRWTTQTELAIAPEPPAQFKHLEQRDQRILGNPVDELATGGWLPTEAPDHTTCHQMWLAASDQTGGPPDDGEHDTLVENSEAFLPDCRMFHAGETSTLLLAHRDAAANIVGFEHMLCRDGTDFDPQFSRGGQSTLFVANAPQTALRAVVAPWGADVLRARADERRHDTVYVSIGGLVSPETELLLQEILQDKVVVGLFDSGDEEQALYAKIKEIAPEIKQLAHEIKFRAVNHVEPLDADETEYDQEGTDVAFSM